MVKKLKDLEDLKLAAAKDSMGDAAAGECGVGSYLLHLVSVYCKCSRTACVWKYKLTIMTVYLLVSSYVD